MFCAYEDTTPLKFGGGVMLLYNEFLSALHLFCCVLCKALLSNICL